MADPMSHDELTKLAAEIVSSREIHALPGDWDPPSLRRLLADLDIDPEAATDAELHDLALMALGDLEPDEAGAAVLRAVFGDSLKAGQRASIAADLEEDRPWEDHAELSKQAGIFTATVLLQQAMPKRFGVPDATQVEVAFRAPTAGEATELLQAAPAVILRALAPGLGPRAIVNRLYEDGVRGAAFPEAASILWRCELRLDPADPCRVMARIHGAQSFLGPLATAEPWESRVDLGAAD